MGFLGVAVVALGGVLFTKILQICRFVLWRPYSLTKSFKKNRGLKDHHPARSFSDTKSNDTSPESSLTLSQMVISIRLVNHFFAFPPVGFSSSYGVFWDPSSTSFQNLDLRQDHG
ncbi:hypothetical protein POTOM_048240 [Populus tomentosa]|uniref:Transmembrane protein n=1 Tax=Populus tomentosa TaxID=118781 RepID=A0A8X7YH80_POPTO|nr:hypothetical protein POTOM_048240 [Populus tomentosa]